MADQRGPGVTPSTAISRTVRLKRPTWAAAPGIVFAGQNLTDSSEQGRRQTDRSCYTTGYLRCSTEAPEKRDKQHSHAPHGTSRSPYRVACFVSDRQTRGA